MNPAKLACLGLPTYHSRVERWECDTNNHWNTRFYARGFQLAAETVAETPEGRSIGAGCIDARHMRFHGELMAGAPVEIRSLVIGGGVFDGHVLHLLSSDGRLSATALDRPAVPLRALPEAPAKELAIALPRGIGLTAQEAAADPVTVELGPVRPLDCDHTGALTFENIVRLVVMGSHKKMNQIGFTPEFISGHGISRMAVEFRVDLHDRCSPGEMLQAVSDLASASGKSFNIAHRLYTRSGRLVATGTQCLVAVDLATRRATTLPDFINAAIQSHR